MLAGMLLLLLMLRNGEELAETVRREPRGAQNGRAADALLAYNQAASVRAR